MKVCVYTYEHVSVCACTCVEACVFEYGSVCVCVRACMAFTGTDVPFTPLPIIFCICKQGQNQQNAGD